MSIRRRFRERTSVVSMVFFLATIAPVVKASDAIASAGDILQIALPITAAGLTLAYRDGKGALQFAESASVTLGVTYALKYAVNETRPDGGHQSFPSAHTSISFSSAEFMRKRYGWATECRPTLWPLLSRTAAWRRGSTTPTT